LDVVSFADLGWELFNDRDKFNIAEHLVVGNILDFSIEGKAANMLDGKMKVVWCSAVLHQFAWDQCIAACRRRVRFAKGPGSLIVGCQVGSRAAEGDLDMHAVTKGVAVEGRIAETQPFKHNAESMRRMWKRVAEELDIVLVVSATWTEWTDFGCKAERCRVMGNDMGVLERTVKLL
jgi:hypothetical protein